MLPRNLPVHLNPWMENGVTYEIWVSSTRIEQEAFNESLLRWYMTLEKQKINFFLKHPAWDTSRSEIQLA